MSRTQGSHRKAVLAGLLTIGLTSTVTAQTSAPATGLGQSWPNAVDVSTAPNWHVYVFRLHGIKYVQINDISGTVHAAIGTANGATIVLPVGVDAQNVGTTASAASAATQVVYHDATTTVTATPQSTGVTTFTVQNQTASCPAYGCSGPGAAAQ